MRGEAPDQPRGPRREAPFRRCLGQAGQHDARHDRTEPAGGAAHPGAVLAAAAEAGGDEDQGRGILALDETARRRLTRYGVARTESMGSREPLTTDLCCRLYRGLSWERVAGVMRGGGDVHGGLAEGPRVAMRSRVPGAIVSEAHRRGPGSGARLRCALRSLSRPRRDGYGNRLLAVDSDRRDVGDQRDTRHEGGEARHAPEATAGGGPRKDSAGPSRRSGAMRPRPGPERRGRLDGRGLQPGPETVRNGLRRTGPVRRAPE